MGKRIFLKMSRALLLLLALAPSTIARADWSATESGTTYELRGIWGSSVDGVKLKLLANKRDIPYQSLIKMFLAERINKELKPAS